MPRVRLSDIVDAMETQSDMTRFVFDKERGDLLALTDPGLTGIGEDEDLSDYPDWERDEIERARLVEVDETGRFVRIPDRFDIHEWEMMRDFATGLDDEARSDALLKAIHGSGAFRYFKDRVREFGIADDWYKYRNGRYREIALDWCEARGIDADPDA